MVFACIHIWISNMTRMIQGLEWLLHGAWFNRVGLLNLEQMTAMGCGSDRWDPGHSEQEWVVYSPFQHKAWETEKKTARSRLRTNKSKQLFPQHLLKLRNSLLGMLWNVCAFKKWSKTSLNTNHLYLTCFCTLKYWRLKEWCWKNVTRCLPCCFSFSLAYSVDHISGTVPC